MSRCAKCDEQMACPVCGWEDRETARAGAFHPDRDGCACEAQGRGDEDECVYADPCWSSKDAFTRETAKQSPPVPASDFDVGSAGQ